VEGNGRNGPVGTGTDQWSEAGPNGSLLARPLRIRPTMVGWRTLVRRTLVRRTLVRRTLVRRTPVRSLELLDV